MVGIVGKFTNELLFIGVRNRYCSICSIAENKDNIPKEHNCHKNWNKPAPAMEVEVEDFTLSEDMHGVRYTQFIADEHSSVFHPRTLKQ